MYKKQTNLLICTGAENQCWLFRGLWDSQDLYIFVFLIISVDNTNESTAQNSGPILIKIGI